MTRIAHIIVSGVVAGVVLTAIGIADADGVLGVLLTPGRIFNRAFGFDSGPPEAGVVYGLAANCVLLSLVIIGIGWTVASVVRRRSTRNDRRTLSGGPC
jgi:hypothetical protein